jgi:HAD superfamily hydrolase (TIGR01490 family)
MPTIPTKKPRKVKLAIFDIDGTIFRSSLLIELVNEFVREEIFPKKVLKDIETDYQAWQNRKGDYEHYIMAVVRVYEKYISGCREKDVVRAARNVIKTQREHMYKFTRDLIKKARSDGFYLVAVSGSPHEIVEMFVRAMRFDAAFGTLYEVKNGRYTGKISLDNTVRDKSKVIRLFLEDYGLTADLQNSLAVGDTQGDVPTLSLVGKPIAFNPNGGLLDIAKKRGWRIVVERKDAILDLKDFKRVDE